jgi:hypothetical protein
VPPRFAYWTILIDNAPTAFRAREAAELLPTLNQLKRKNKDVVLKWFARGRLWESQQQERDDLQRRKLRARTPAPKGAHEKRGRDWRPGGAHKDPRARFAKSEKKAPRRSSHDDKRAEGKLREPRRERPGREAIRNKAHKKGWDERPRRDDRRDQPERKEQEPPPRRPERPPDTPEPPPSPEQIVIKPEPPERG